jgi:ABC-type xylose transport system permease subunit
MTRSFVSLTRTARSGFLTCETAATSTHNSICWSGSSRLGRGRSGKALHGALGGIVIASIDNGMGLLGFSAASKFMVTAVVLLAAVTIDALTRRGRTPGT